MNDIDPKTKSLIAKNISEFCKASQIENQILINIFSDCCQIIGSQQNNIENYQMVKDLLNNNSEVISKLYNLGFELISLLYRANTRENEFYALLMSQGLKEDVVKEYIKSYKGLLDRIDLASNPDELTSISIPNVKKFPLNTQIGKDSMGISFGEIVDIEWKLLILVKNKNIDNISEPIFKIKLYVLSNNSDRNIVGECSRIDWLFRKIQIVDFMCNMTEMIELNYQVTQALHNVSLREKMITIEKQN